MSAIYYQDPVSTLDYNIDWTAWLSGDTIITSTWTTHPDLTVSNTASTGTVVTAYLAGGTPGKTYKVKNKISTTNGRTEEETFDLTIRTH